MIEGKKGGGVGVFALKRATNSKSARILELRTPLDEKITSWNATKNCRNSLSRITPKFLHRYGRYYSNYIWNFKSVLIPLEAYRLKARRDTDCHSAILSMGHRINTSDLRPLC